MSVHSGHRDRLDKKVIERGLEMLEPHEQLEHLLFAVIPRNDTNDLAHRLLDRFRSIAGVLNADVEELMEIEGVGKRCAMFLSTLPQLLGIVERSVTIDAPPLLDSLEAIENFAKTYFYGKLIEEAYVVSLNSTYRLLGISRIAQGAQDETHVYPALAVKQAIRDNASAVIVMHNHPCGILAPSQSDFTLTAKLAIAFQAVDIEFYDSIIVSGGKCFSMDQNYTLEKIVKTYLSGG